MGAENSMEEVRRKAEAEVDADEDFARASAESECVGHGGRIALTVAPQLAKEQLAESPMEEVRRKAEAVVDADEDFARASAENERAGHEGGAALTVAPQLA